MLSRHHLPLLLVAMVLLASCGGRAGTNGEISLAEGDRAPSFNLASANGGKVQLSDFAEKKSVLLYFSMGPG